MNECHGHQNDLECIKCELYNSLTFSWNMLCPKNKEMPEYKIKQQLEQKQGKINKSQKEIQKSISSEVKINKKSFFKKQNFFYNFQYGCNFFSEEKSYTVKLYNLDTDTLIQEIKTEPGKIYSSPQKFYIRWGIKVYDDKKCIFDYQLNLQNQNVLIYCTSKCLGDNLAYMESVSAFQKKYQCNVSCKIKKTFYDLFSFNYPNIHFITKKENKKYIASYKLFCGGIGSQYSTIVYDRIVSLERIAKNILQVEYDKPQKFKINNMPEYGNKYVVYSEKASAKMKEWNNPKALKETISYLQNLGYTVVNIDIKPINKNIKDVVYLNGIEYTLQDKVDIISNADFFIGLPSGLSWLAWCCHKPAIVIGSFSLPICEFDNPYRVFSTDACFGCWNYMVNNHQCIKYGKEFAICNKIIGSKQVIETIDKLIKNENL